jgi:hypothetical protein
MIMERLIIEAMKECAVLKRIEPFIIQLTKPEKEITNSYVDGVVQDSKETIDKEYPFAVYVMASGSHNYPIAEKIIKNLGDEWKIDYLDTKDVYLIRLENKKFEERSRANCVGCKGRSSCTSPFKSA